MTNVNVVLRVVRQLDDLEIPYMVTGSFASSHHGRPRATQDVDIVIDPSPSSLSKLVERVGQLGLYVDGARAQDALARRRQFNVIDPQTGWKIDLIIVKARPFSREELRRRRPVETLGVTLALATPEDSILSKLEWARASGGSSKQLDDVAGIVATQTALDRPYLEHWARELGVLDLWEQVSGQASPEGEA